MKVFLLAVLMVVGLSNAACDTTIHACDGAIQYVMSRNDGTIGVSLEDASQRILINSFQSPFILDVSKVGATRFDLLYTNAQTAVAHRLSMYLEYTVVGGQKYLQTLSIYNPEYPIPAN